MKKLRREKEPTISRAYRIPAECLLCTVPSNLHASSIRRCCYSGICQRWGDYIANIARVSHISISFFGFLFLNLSPLFSFLTIRQVETGVQTGFVNLFDPRRESLSLIFLFIFCTLAIHSISSSGIPGETAVLLSSELCVWASVCHFPALLLV